MEEYSNETFILDLVFLKEIAERVSSFKSWILSLFLGLLLGIAGNFIVTLIGDTWIVNYSIEIRGYLALLIILNLSIVIFLFFLFIKKIFPNLNLREINLDLWYARTKQIKPDRQYISRKYIFSGLR